MLGKSAFSAADEFELLTLAVSRAIKGQNLSFPLKVTGLLGPDGFPPESQTNHLYWPAFRDTTLDVLNFIQTEHRIPARVFVGADLVPPSDFLIALAGVYETYRTKGTLPLEAGVTLPKNLRLLPARYVAEDSPGLFGGWIIHKEGFRAPKIMDIARLQAWTLKPAIPAH